MTLLEITGFALVTISALGLGWACWAQRREIERLRGDVDRLESLASVAIREGVERWVSLQAIANATRDGKSGTAKKVHRMAMEGLNNEQA